MWFALWIIKSSRCKQIKEGTPYQYHISELYRYFKRVSKKALDEALQELESLNLVKFTESDIWFAEHFEDLANDQARDHAVKMFEELHPSTRDKRISFPRRMLKLIIQSGQKVVRVATLLGLLLRIMLVKKFEDYRGCIKASWIASLFGVSCHRVRVERSKLIDEEIFTRIPTPQRVKNRYGEWIVLNLDVLDSDSPVENTTETSPNLEPPAPEDSPKLVPLINQFLSPNGEIQENQNLASDDPGVSQLKIPEEPTWTNIIMQDLEDFERSEQLRQEVYRGCIKASWIASLFGVSCHRVRVERSKLIDEEIFTRIPTPQRVKNRYGEWIVLNLDVLDSDSPVENTTETSPNLEPPAPEDSPKLVPLINQFLSPNGEIQENQNLASDDPGVSQLKIPEEPTWTNIIMQDLEDFERSEQLRQEALDQGLLRDTIADREKFFAAIAHTIRVATKNACGMLRTIVEKGLWNFLTQADEYNGIRRLRSDLDNPDRTGTVLEGLLTGENEFNPPDEHQVELSQDAQIVQILTADLAKIGVTSDVFRTVEQHGFLQDWNRQRWLNAEMELTQKRLFQRRLVVQCSSALVAECSVQTTP